jgi:hypothetical protein
MSGARHRQKGDRVLLDRAATLAVAVLQIIDTAPKQSARQELEKYLRDELADLARQAAAERELSDDV